MEPQLLNQFRHFIAGHRDNLVTWLKSDSKHINTPLGEASPEEVAQVVSLHDDALAPFVAKIKKGCNSSHFFACLCG